MDQNRNSKISRRTFLENSATGAVGFTFFSGLPFSGCLSPLVKHVWEPIEISLPSNKSYENPYMEVDVWIQLKGPGFDEKIYGFWDGSNTFRVRFVATGPGKWTWTSGSNQEDSDLNGKTGSFDAIEWTEEEKTVNPNRRGFLRSNGRTFEYADGTPFFLLSDTHWAISTWRHPWKGNNPSHDYQPQKGMGFEEFMQYEKAHGYNAISMIASFPNWDDEDGHPNHLYDNSGIPIRHAWAKPDTGGSYVKAMNMHDEDGNRPFLMGGLCDGKKDSCAHWNRINPPFWQSFDRKFRYMHENGMIFQMESLRREHFCTIFKYHDWEQTVSRYLLYLRARYGCFNQIFNVCHCDSLNFSDENGIWVLSEDDLRVAFEYFFATYGPLPFGQPVAAMSGSSTLDKLGHADWLEIHTTSNQRDAEAYPRMNAMYNKTPHKPVVHLEPYYAGAWFGNFRPHRPFEAPAEPGSSRDDYWARTNAWGSVFNGGTAGHVFGSDLFDGVKEPEPNDVWTWHGIKRYESHRQMKHLKNFVLSEAKNMQNMVLANENVTPNQSPGWVKNRMSNNAYMLQSKDKSIALVYFEEGCKHATLKNMNPDGNYEVKWFNTRTGEWMNAGNLSTNENGEIPLPEFPGNLKVTRRNEDWALKLVNEEV